MVETKKNIFFLTENYKENSQYLRKKKVGLLWGVCTRILLAIILFIFSLHDMRPNFKKKSLFKHSYKCKNTTPFVGGWMR